MDMKLTAALAVWLLVAVAAKAQDNNVSAELNETVFKLPTTIRNMYNATYTREIIVTQYKPNGPGPFPIAVLLHGRSPTDRSQPARQRYTQAAGYFVRRGFAVWVPTRMGYGESGVDPDPEDSGSCINKRYTPGYEAAATEALDVIAYAKRQDFADPNRIIVLGQSYGGATSIALAAKMPPGVMAAINFAGGGGGDPDTHPQRPCRPELLEAMFRDYGKTARIPTLWVYTENDKYFGADYPKRWFAAFRKQGGSGEYKAMPAFGDNGHSLFARGFPLWRPLIDDFLSHLGFPMPHSVNRPPASGYARLDEVDKLPLVKAQGREKYQRFLTLDLPRAYAIGPKGEYFYQAASADAMSHVLNGCRKIAKTECKLYAVDDDVVWTQ